MHKNLHASAKKLHWVRIKLGKPHSNSVAISFHATLPTILGYHTTIQIVVIPQKHWTLPVLKPKVCRNPDSSQLKLCILSAYSHCNHA